MNPIYQAALNGTLMSPTSGAAVSGVQVYNQLPCAIQVYFVTSSGYRSYVGKINAQSNAPLSGAIVGDYYIFLLPQSGAFISAIEIASGVTSYYVANTSLIDPNDIGAIPQPTQTILVPPNSPSVLVSIGTIPPTPPNQAAPASASVVTREQYWALQGDSYSIVPGESRTTSFTVTSGKQETSSDQATVSSSLGLSAGGGWGPVSASVSASLNVSASLFQQVTVTEQTSTYVSDVVSNTSQNAVLALRWQMADVVTVYNSSGSPLSAINSGSVVIVQAYDLSKLGDTLARPALVHRLPSPALGASMQTALA
ncbi:MAG: hypothetical protein JSR72_17660 [Proteobacteria bacterium]|nr:hypothetical protein [Pseudomonadota bacterium]